MTLGIILAGATVSAICDDDMHHKKLKTVGTVIAYNLPVSGLAMLTSVPIEQFLVVRIDKPVNRKRTLRYIKVSYRRWFNEPELPSGVLDGGNKWHFVLSRDSSCDGSVRELESTKGKTEDGKEVILQLLRRTMGAEEAVPDELILPCYVLRPGDLKPVQ